MRALSPSRAIALSVVWSWPAVLYLPRGNILPRCNMAIRAKVCVVNEKSCFRSSNISCWKRSRRLLRRDSSLRRANLGLRPLLANQLGTQKANKQNQVPRTSGSAQSFRDAFSVSCSSRVVVESEGSSCTFSFT